MLLQVFLQRSFGDIWKTWVTFEQHKSLSCLEDLVYNILITAHGTHLST